MALRRIQPRELEELAARWHFSFADGEIEEFVDLTGWLAETIEQLDCLPAARPRVLEAQRDPGRRATPEDDPYNAVVRWCRVRAEFDGLLSGLRVGVKDVVAVAGVPLTCGSPVFDSFVPDRDAVVTERILTAGGEIVCTTNMDHLATAASGDTSAFGYTRNPFDPNRTAGGSSGGSAAALHYDDVDVTIGCDQGGSIRVPSAWCGVVGLKPTHGLVPYTGIVGIDPSFDHCGPMARTVGDAARLLQVIAEPGADYLRALAGAPDDLRDVRVGVVSEGFVGVDPDVAGAVRGVIESIRELHADVRDVSIPEHAFAEAVTLGSSIEGMAMLLAGGGNGYHRTGEYWPGLAAALNRGLASSAGGLSDQMKLILVFGTHMQRTYLGEWYAKAQGVRSAMRTGYDRALAECDLLVMPTTPTTAHLHVEEMPVAARVRRGWAPLANTSATDMTGHPALTLPAAETGGLPVGVMLVGRRFDEARMLQLAETLERNVGWRP
ncbi:MAG TPA: amidase family protein [Gaiellaceae bacterium]|jgi:amidase|nr:amidase family protein [Gaiellaceae bacterium]